MLPQSNDSKERVVSRTSSQGNAFHVSHPNAMKSEQGWVSRHIERYKSKMNYMFILQSRTR